MADSKDIAPFSTLSTVPEGNPAEPTPRADPVSTVFVWGFSKLFYLRRLRMANYSGVGIAQDYAKAAFQEVLENSRLEPESVTILGCYPGPGDVTVRVEGRIPAMSGAAAVLLRRHFPRGLFPIGVRIFFEP